MKQGPTPESEDLQPEESVDSVPDSKGLEAPVSRSNEAASDNLTEDFNADDDTAEAVRAEPFDENRDDDVAEPLESFPQDVFRPRTSMILGGISRNIANKEIRSDLTIVLGETTAAICADLRLITAWLLLCGYEDISVIDITRRKDGSSFGEDTPNANFQEILNDVQSETVVVWLGDIARRAGELLSLGITHLNDLETDTRHIVFASDDWSDASVELLEKTTATFIDTPDDEVLQSLCENGQFFKSTDFQQLKLQLSNGIWAKMSRGDLADIRVFLDEYCQDEEQCRQIYEDNLDENALDSWPSEWIEQVNDLVADGTPIDCACLFLLDSLGDLPLLAFERLSETLAPAISKETPEDAPPQQIGLSDSVLRRCKIKTYTGFDGQRWVRLQTKWTNFVRETFRSRLPLICRRLEDKLILESAPLIGGFSFSEMLANLIAQRIVDDNLFELQGGWRALSSSLFAGRRPEEERFDQLLFVTRVCSKLLELKSGEGVRGLVRILNSLAQHTDQTDIGQRQKRQCWWLMWGLITTGPEKAIPDLVTEVFSIAKRNPAIALSAIDRLPAPQPLRMKSIIYYAGVPFLEEDGTLNKGELRLREEFIDILVAWWLTSSLQSTEPGDRLINLGAELESDLKANLRQIVAKRLVQDQIDLVQMGRWTRGRKIAFTIESPSPKLEAVGYVRGCVRTALPLLERHRTREVPAFSRSFAKARLFGQLGLALIYRPPEALLSLQAMSGELEDFYRRCSNFSQLPLLTMLAILHDKNSDGSFHRDDRITEIAGAAVKDQKASQGIRSTISELAEDVFWAREFMRDVSSLSRDDRRANVQFLRELRSTLKQLSIALKPSRKR